MRQYLKKNILVLFFFILQFITKIYIYISHCLGLQLMEPIPYRKQKKTQVLDLKLSVTYWLFVVLMSPPPSSERFRHVSQTRCPFFFFVFSPFIGSVPPLFLLSSFTQCHLFHSISYVSFSTCLFSIFLSFSFFVLCASITATHVKVIPISSLLCFLYFILPFYFFIYAFFFFTCHMPL